MGEQREVLGLHQLGVCVCGWLHMCGVCILITRRARWVYAIANQKYGSHRGPV